LSIRRKFNFYESNSFFNLLLQKAVDGFVWNSPNDEPSRSEVALEILALSKESVKDFYLRFKTA
jgi:hypothetical protein